MINTLYIASLIFLCVLILFIQLWEETKISENNNQKVLVLKN